MSVDQLRRTAEAQQHSTGDVHGVSVKPSELLALLDLAEAVRAFTGPLSEEISKALDRVYDA